MLVASLDGCLDLVLGDDLRSHGRIVCTLEHMLVDDGLKVYIGRLILIGRSIVRLHAQLRHSVIRTEREAGAADIYPLAEFVIAIERRLADLDVDAAGTVLDIQLAIDIAGTVGGNDLALDPDIAGDLDTGRLVHGLQGLDGSELREMVAIYELRLRNGDELSRFVGVDGEHRLPFFLQTLAGNERQKGAD